MVALPGLRFGHRRLGGKPLGVENLAGSQSTEVPLKKRLALVAAALMVLAAPTAATAQGAPTTLAVEQAPTRVAAWTGVAMW